MLDEAKSSGGLMFDVLESTVRAGYLRVGKAIGLTFTPHDLRRTFATTAVRTGCSEVIVKRMLNHAAQGVTQKHYLRLSVEDLREPMAALEVRMLGLWGVAAP
jgi:integrase